MALLIEEMTKQASAQDEYYAMEKAASDLRTLDQSRAMVSIADTIHKYAEEGSPLYNLALNTYHIGTSFGACLSKTASAEGALDEAIELADDLYKVASTFVAISNDYPSDEDFLKMAKIMDDISDEMQDELGKLAGVQHTINQVGTNAYEIVPRVEEAAPKMELRTQHGKAKPGLGEAARRAMQWAGANKGKAAGIAAGTVAALAAAGYGVHKLNQD